MATCIECSYYKPCEARDDRHDDLVGFGIFGVPKYEERIEHINAGDEGTCYAEPRAREQYRDRPACRLFAKKAEA